MKESDRPTDRPLGIRADVQLDPDQLRALDVLETYDLGSVRDRVIRNELMPKGVVDEAIFEFRRYLGLRGILQRPVPMLSRPVDEIWHSCILFTRLYADLCDRSFGFFIHHEPVTESDRDAAWQEFVNAYTSLFGDPSGIWQLARPDF